jgi:hypothetical protein
MMDRRDIHLIHLSKIQHDTLIKADLSTGEVNLSDIIPADLR